MNGPAPIQPAVPQEKLDLVVETTVAAITKVMERHLDAKYERVVNVGLNLFGSCLMHECHANPRQMQAMAKIVEQRLQAVMDAHQKIPPK